MVGAIATVHLRFGLFLNWFGTQQGHGIEFHLLAIALALVVVDDSQYNASDCHNPVSVGTCETLDHRSFSSTASFLPASPTIRTW
jgi:hypothetical protein